ncbi:MAG: carbohydrate ABC transporter permease [Rhizobiales bacterium]|nr:carbohydrate ABC transporter permease [Hyphomicrobiales bacterium]
MAVQAQHLDKRTPSPPPVSGKSTLSGAPDWEGLARRGKRRRTLNQGVLLTFLITVSIPILIPYFWMFTISVSARTGGVESVVLWKACAILVPAVIAFAVVNLLTADTHRRLYGYALIVILALAAIVWSIGRDLHLENWGFLSDPDMVAKLQGRRQATVESQFPWVWTALFNSLALAMLQTVLVLTVSTLAGYYLSRFQFAGRASFLQALLVLHAFPAMTLIIPIFLMMYWTGMLDTLTGVILIIATLELPFAIFIMKGFFDAVPWDIEMSAMTDGASRRQAFFQVVLPQVKVGLLAVGVFAFLKGWEEYVFVRTLLFEKQNWTMSLYLFWVSEDIMGVDYGVVAAVGVLYVLPSLILYLLCQKYLVQMTIGGIKG